MKINKKGFTLLELLVVVLIIGILAAIAVPQYNKAVWKARFAEARVDIKAIETAIESYVLSQTLPTEETEITFLNPEDLDIDIPNTTLKTIGDWPNYCSKHMCYAIGCTNICSWWGFVHKDTSNLADTMENENIPGTITEMHGRLDNPTWYRYCFYEDKIGQTLCETTNWDDVEGGF